MFVVRIEEYMHLFPFPESFEMEKKIQKIKNQQYQYTISYEEYVFP